MFGFHQHLVVEVSEFNNAQVTKYLSHRNITEVPDWLPARPLLLGHLAARKVLGSALELLDEDMSPAECWDWLLSEISHREAELVDVGISGQVVREIIERLASTARKNSSGLGPIYQRDIIEAFVGVRGQEPSDSEQAILQRLPGLARDPELEEGSRSFIDADLAGVAQARDMSDYASNPYHGIEDRAVSWELALSALGIDVAACQYARRVPGKGHLMHAHKHAARRDLNIAQADLVRISIQLGHSIDEPVSVDGVHIPSLLLSDNIPNLSGVSFNNCLFDRIDFDGDVIEASRLPHFDSCYIHEIYGRQGWLDLPPNTFSENCEIDAFPDAVDRNSAIASTSLPPGVRTVLTILRKLYLQAGRGRLEGGLSRGLPQEERTLVLNCLTLLQKEGLAVPIRIQSRKIWVPNRSAQRRALQFIEAPRGSGDSLYGLASRM
jgi:hypothetical protein